MTSVPAMKSPQNYRLTASLIMLENRYESPDLASPGFDSPDHVDAPTSRPKPGPRPRPHWTSQDYHSFAGHWLIVVGVVHFFAMNIHLKTLDASTIQWSPLYLIGLGILVRLRFRMAALLVRLAGSFVMVGLIFAIALIVLCIFRGDGDFQNNEIVIAGFVSSDPLIVLTVTSVGIATTFVPLWWALQLAVSDERRFNREQKYRQASEGDGVDREPPFLRL